jgi:GMP synthase-like glutamine amidotransferase
MHIHILQHVPFEGPGYILPWAEQSHHRVSITPVYKEESLPAPESFHCLVIMGGPMSVHDEDDCPWLAAEKNLVEESIKAKKKVLGICFGAQIIAQALGAAVYTNKHKEIGWYELLKTDDAAQNKVVRVVPDPFVAFHWHGETFDLPTGAVHLAHSAACENQAFAYKDHVLALQFHLESTAESISALIKNCPADLSPGLYVQHDPAQLINQDLIDRSNALMKQVLDGFIGKS